MRIPSATSRDRRALFAPLFLQARILIVNQVSCVVFQDPARTTPQARSKRSSAVARCVDHCRGLCLAANFLAWRLRGADWFSTRVVAFTSKKGVVVRLAVFSEQQHTSRLSDADTRLFFKNVWLYINYAHVCPGHPLRSCAVFVSFRLADTHAQRLETLSNPPLGQHPKCTRLPRG